MAQLHLQVAAAIWSRLRGALSIRDIARRESVPEGTVLSRIFTGKQLLRQAWDAPASAGQLQIPPSKVHQPEAERPESPGSLRIENERSNDPEPMKWDR